MLQPLARSNNSPKTIRNIIMPKKYQRYVEQIHNKVYIPSLRKENKEKITRNKVKEYLNILNPCELLLDMSS